MMKSSKAHPFDLHLESKTSGLAYVLVYAMAHFLLLTCVTLLNTYAANIWTDLLTMKVLIGGHIVIGLFILLPISSLFGNQKATQSLTGTRIKGHKSEKPKTLLSTPIYSIALYICGIAVFHFISILFGAPLIREMERTCHFAALLSSEAVLPGIIIFGCSSEKWVRVFITNETLNAMELIIKISSMTSVIGAWLGAFPIPLDWDRPWQMWPVSCMIGTSLGFSAGLLGGIIYIQYLKMKYGKKHS